MNLSFENKVALVTRRSLRYAESENSEAVNGIGSGI